MKKFILSLFFGLICQGCGNSNSVERPYIISQAPLQEDEVAETSQELD